MVLDNIVEKRLIIKRILHMERCGYSAHRYPNMNMDIWELKDILLKQENERVFVRDQEKNEKNVILGRKRSTV